MGGIIFVSCIDHLMNHNVVTLGLVIAHSAPLFSVFAELQFCGFALLLRKRFCWINMKMEDLVNKQSQRNRPVSKRSALAQKNIILTLLQKIGDKHHELCTITKQLNKAYAVQMLLFMIQAFLIIIIMSFYLIKMYLLNSFQEITPNEKIVYINTLTFQISLVFIIVLICSSTSKEARKAGILLHNLVSLNSVNGVESFDIEVACFSLQLLHHNVKFTACRLFVVDETLLYTIFGAATTYLVIVLQFEFGISTASNAANELKSAAQTIKPQ
uniref:Gustatory receptor n=3 Tax=Photinus pyralis TaxID=7054 RepID=A0A1Y1MG70_PHOPY